jgi:hypothetical protein
MMWHTFGVAGKKGPPAGVAVNAAAGAFQPAKTSHARFLSPLDHSLIIVPADHKH